MRDEQGEKIAASTALENFGVRKMVCPHCGKRSDASRYLEDVFAALRNAIAAGFVVMLPGLGILTMSEAYGPDLEDSYFHTRRRKFKVPYIRATRYTIELLTKAAKRFHN